MRYHPAASYSTLACRTLSPSVSFPCSDKHFYTCKIFQFSQHARLAAVTFIHFFQNVPEYQTEFEFQTRRDVILEKNSFVYMLYMQRTQSLWRDYIAQIKYHIRARTQDFAIGGANFNLFCRRGCECYENANFGAKIRGVK